MRAANARERRRGQPLAVFVAIALAWIGARVVLWDRSVVDDPAHARTASPAVAPTAAPALPLVRQASAVVPSYPSSGEDPARVERARVIRPSLVQRRGQLAAVEPPPTFPTREPSAESRPAPVRPVDPSSPPARSVATASEGAPDAVPGRARVSARWHVDGWYAWRPGSGQPRVVAGGPRAPAYGGTQGGIVVRYVLADDGRRPQAYLRATHAPARPNQADVALGFGLRPVASIPVRIQGEARATRTLGRTEVRPAVTAITEFAPAELPLGFRIESYAQAGYVGGHEATAFVDGQVRADRRVASLGDAELRVGGGAWGGAQKYAERLDVGPAVTLDLRGAGVPARLSLDYRMRIAGHARPSDGPALTISTGF